MKKPQSNIPQTDAEDQSQRAASLWVVCTLVALMIGSGSDLSDAGDFIKSLKARGHRAWSIISRDGLYIHLGIPVRGLPSTDLDKQVRELQGQVVTHTGKAFVQLTGPGTDTSLELLEPIDYFCWLMDAGDFQIPWHLIDPKVDEYDYPAAVLLGELLGRLGKTIAYGTPIMNAVNTIISQYKRGEGLLPMPFTPRPSLRPMARPPPPNHQLPSQQLLSQQLLSQQLLSQQLLSQQLLSQQLLSPQLQLLSQQLSVSPQPAPPQLAALSQLFSQQLQVLSSQFPASTSQPAPQPEAISQQQPPTSSSQPAPQSAPLQPAALSSQLSRKQSNTKADGIPGRKDFIIGPDDETK